jgi:hypothetical protein
MTQEEYNLLAERISQSVSKALREEFSRYMMLDEMARVGFMGNFDVIVNTDDPGYVPHFHIIDKATRGGEFNTCIKLETNQYFLHGSHTDKLNAKQRKVLNEFMHAPHRNIHYRNNYEYNIQLLKLMNKNEYYMRYKVSQYARLHNVTTQTVWN